MNPKLSLFLLPLVLTASASAQLLSFNLQSLGSPDASSIVFTPTGGNDLDVTFQANASAQDFSISGGSPTNLNSLNGTITGSFTISNITASTVGGVTVDTGTVSSSSGASLTISDGAGDTEAAHLWWNSAETVLSSGSLGTFDMTAGTSARTYPSSPIPAPRTHNWSKTSPTSLPATPS